MHKVPWFSRQRHKQKAMKSEQKLSRPRLERRYAVKDIEYEVSDSSTSSSSSSVLRARSLDVLPLIDNTSFRIEGNDSKLEMFCRSLGLKGPEDFEIPVEAWEAMKLRSSSDVLPTSGWRSQFDGIDVQSQQVEVNELSGTLADRVSSVPEPGEFNTSRNGGGDGLAVSSRFNDKIIVRGVSVNDNDPVGRDMLVRGGGGLRGGGIKGVRPPVLAPPSYLNHDRSSPEIDEKIDDEISKREGSIDLRITEAAAISEALCTTTSNDDDSSSTSTEPTSSISPNVRIRRTISSWDKGELLGRGSFGSVYEGIADGGFFFAVKEVSLLDQGEWGRQSIFQLEQEIALLSQFQHENIVLYYGTKKDESNLYIFLELVKGSLLNLYHKYNLRDSQVSEYTRQILHGLKYLHDRKVLHRDIKCANILYDTSGSVKLADFGLAKATKLNDVKSCKGTAFWMAPEVVNRKNQGYGLAADIWSLGCTVLEMLTHQLPYYPLDCMQALFRIGKGIPPPIPDSLSGDARDFINDCLQVDPSARPTALQLLDHSFVKRT